MLPVQGDNNGTIALQIVSNFNQKSDLVKMSLIKNIIAMSSTNTTKAAGDSTETEFPPQLQATGRSQTFNGVPHQKVER